MIDFREVSDRSASERNSVEAAGMRYVSIPFRGMSPPSPADVAKVLALFDDPSASPVFVHCRRGADRTGTVIACYRIAHNGWDNQKALQEAKQDGMSWTEVAMHHYVEHFQPTLNTAAASTVAMAATQQN